MFLGRDILLNILVYSIIMSSTYKLIINKEKNEFITLKSIPNLLSLPELSRLWPFLISKAKQDDKFKKWLYSKFDKRYHNILNNIYPEQPSYFLFGIKIVYKNTKSMIDQSAKVNDEIARILEERYKPYLRNYRKYPDDNGFGLLLYGPPGTGKTFLVRYFAEKTKNILIYEPTRNLVSNTMDVKAIFKIANLFNKSILLLDEVDVITFNRNANYTARIISSNLMSQLDSPESKGVLTVGTTNSPWDVDSAFLRSGRFSDIFYFGPPNYKERVRLIDYFYKKLETNIDTEYCARLTKGYSISDIKYIIKLSISYSLYKHKKKITIDDFKYGFRNTRNSCEDWFYQYKFLPNRVKKTFKIKEIDD